MINVLILVHFDFLRPRVHGSIVRSCNVARPVSHSMATLFISMSRGGRNASYEPSLFRMYGTRESTVLASANNKRNPSSKY